LIRTIPVSKLDSGAHSMTKIRINELARELEVKPSVILDMLPELGVTEKKTHSSSIDEPVALEVKRRLGGESNGAPHAAAPEPDRGPIPAAEPAPPVEQPRVSGSKVEAAPEPPQSARETAPETPPAPAPRSAPLRPPLASGQPLSPPMAPRGIPIPARPAPPAPKPGQILSGPRQPLPSPPAEARVA